MRLRHSDVAPIGPVVTGSMLWRFSGRLHVTAMVKATFAFHPEQLMTLVSPVGMVAADQPHEGRPGSSIRSPSDVVPYLARADVLFCGHAHTPGVEPTVATDVRLALFRGERPLVDKRARVSGDSVRGPDGPGERRPFTRMSMVYERAVGDGSDGDNPLGVVEHVGWPLPNIIDLRAPTQPTCFGPLSPSWRQRRGQMTDEVLALLAAPVPEIPADFDWAFFQAAPTDQRTEWLQGDEWLHLEGLVPGGGRIRTGLPEVTGEARVWARGVPDLDATVPVELRADMLFIDGDAQQCTVTWRGCFPLESEQVLDAIHLAAGVSRPGAPIDWEAAVAAVARGKTAPAPRARVSISWDGMLTLFDQPTKGEFPPRASTLQPSESSKPEPSSERSAQGKPTTPAREDLQATRMDGTPAALAAKLDEAMAKRAAPSGPTPPPEESSSAIHTMHEAQQPPGLKPPVRPARRPAADSSPVASKPGGLGTHLREADQPADEAPTVHPASADARAGLGSTEVLPSTKPSRRQDIKPQLQPTTVRQTEVRPSAALLRRKDVKPQLQPTVVLEVEDLTGSRRQPHEPQPAPDLEDPGLFVTLQSDQASGAAPPAPLAGAAARGVVLRPAPVAGSPWTREPPAGVPTVRSASRPDSRPGAPRTDKQRFPPRSEPKSEAPRTEKQHFPPKSDPSSGGEDTT